MTKLACWQLFSCVNRNFVILNVIKGRMHGTWYGANLEPLGFEAVSQMKFVAVHLKLIVDSLQIRIIVNMS